MNALKLMGRGDDLSADEEARFRAWLKRNPDSTKTDAELRQLWRAQQAATPAAATENPRVPAYPQAGDWRDRLHRLRPLQNPGDLSMEQPPPSDARGLTLTDPRMSVPRRSNALQGPMPIAAWSGDGDDPTSGGPKLSWADIEKRLADSGVGEKPITIWDEREIPIPTWGQRLSENRPATYQTDLSFVVAPRRADVDLLQGQRGVVTRGDLLGTPRDTPVDQLPSYQQGTDYVPEDGPAKLHEGEMVIPKREADRIRAADMPTVTVKPQRTLSQDEIEKRLRDQGYSPAGAKGIAQNFIRESGGDAGNVSGDHGTSRGLAQWHADRKDDLEAFARDQKGSAADPDIQFRFLNKEMTEKFPALRAQLMASDNAADAESKFRRIFERPASVMWSNDASGRPVLGNDRYRFSDFAMGEHQGRRGTSLLYMDPQDYLDLSPPFDDDPKTSRSGRSLRASVGRGDAVESVPSLDMRVNGQTGTVTAQDGRNRALLAQEEGLDAIPVAVRQKGQGEPTEIAGMSGTILPNDFRKAEHVSRETSPDRSILGRAMDMIIPRAEAAQTRPSGAQPTDENPYARFAKPQEDAASEENPYARFAKPKASGGDANAKRDDPPDPSTSAPGLAASITRGLAPYAAGAGIGAGIGAMAGGVGAIPGAVAGAGAVALSDLATAAYRPIARMTGLPEVPSFSEGTNKLLDLIGIRQPQTGLERMAQTTASGVGGATAGVRAAEGLAATLTNPAAKQVAARLAERPVAQMVSGGTAGASSQAAAEAGLGPTGQAVTGFLGSLVPFGPRAVASVASAEPRQAATQAHQAGYVLPPIEAAEKPSLSSNFLAMWSGKIKSQQSASAKNQPVTNQIAASELGLPPDTMLTDQVFEDVRREAGKAYGALKAIPSITNTPTFDAAINAIGADARAAAKDYPGIINVDAIEKMRQELLAQPQRPTASAIEVVKRLRFDSKANLKARDDPDRLTLGLAQRQAANAVDDLMEENLAQTGNPDLVRAYREARTTIAKSYDIESVTNTHTGDVSARGLGRLADKGKPLTDGLKTIAETANAFPKSMQNPAAFGGNEPLSAIDYFAAVAAAGAGRWELLPMLGGRPLARSLMLSGPYQRTMMAPKQGPVPMSVIGTPLMPAIQPP